MTSGSFEALILAWVEGVFLLSSSHGHSLLLGTARDKQDNDRTSGDGSPCFPHAGPHTTQPARRSRGSVQDTSGPRFICNHRSIGQEAQYVS
jgi:hypothetical protein